MDLSVSPPTHDAPAVTLFGSTGGVGARPGPPVKTRGGVGGADAEAHALAATADDFAATEEKRTETERETRKDVLGELRALEKEIERDDWKFERPRHSRCVDEGGREEDVAEAS